MYVGKEIVHARKEIVHVWKETNFYKVFIAIFNLLLFYIK